MFKLIGLIIAAIGGWYFWKRRTQGNVPATKGMPSANMPSTANTTNGLPSWANFLHWSTFGKSTGTGAIGNNGGTPNYRTIATTYRQPSNLRLSPLTAARSSYISAGVYSLSPVWSRYAATRRIYV